MLRALRLAALALGASTMLLTFGPTTAVASAPVNAIGTVSVQNVDGNFQVTVDFTHRGPVELRIIERASPTDTTGIDSADRWFRGSGADTFIGTLVGGSGRYVEVHLLKADHRAGALVDVVPHVTVGPYTS